MLLVTGGGGRGRPRYLGSINLEIESRSNVPVISRAREIGEVNGSVLCKGLFGTHSPLPRRHPRPPHPAQTYEYRTNISWIHNIRNITFMLSVFFVILC